MSTEMIEQKLVDLTRRMERLEAKLQPLAKPTWRDAFGMMKDDDLFEEAMKLGAEWRAKMNAEGR